MRNNKGQFVKGQPSWNKDKKGWTNNGSFIKGHEVSEEWRKNVSKIHKGNTYRLGSVHTDEAKEKNRLAHLGKVTTVGEKCWNWKGGITPFRKKLYFSKEYKLWRKTIFERDDYKCQKCGQCGELNADHIKPWSLYPELRFDINNGRTLCLECHRQTETWGIRKGQNI